MAEELEKELSEIRREVIEARNLVIKTDNLLKNLHAELKMVSKRQEEFQKRQWISSAMAYALFALLCAAAAWGVASARTSTATQERNRLEKEVESLNAQLERERLSASQNLAASKGAQDSYRMMTELSGEDRLKGIDALRKLDTSKISILEQRALSDRAEQLKKEVGQSAFEKGKNAYRRNEMTVAAQDLERFLTMSPQSESATEASFYLGGAYYQLKKYDQAIAPLNRFTTQDRKSKNRDYALLMLAQSYEQAGQPEKAAQTARDAMGTYPNSQFFQQFKARLSSAKKQSSSASPAAAH